MIDEAKRLVVRELELRTFGRPVPAPTIRFLNMYWGPLLVKRLLQHGADHRHWREGLDLLEQMLDLLEMPVDESATEVWRSLVSRMTTALATARLGADRLKDGLALLQATRRAPRPRGAS